MLRGITRKAVVLVTAGALAVIGGVAFAYWTNTGTGSGTATTGSNDAITVNQVSTITDLGPGRPAQTLSGNFDNPNDNQVFVGSVTAEVTGTDVAACDASNYTVAGSAPVAAEVPSGTGVGTWSGLTIQFNNKPTVNQDACKNAVVSITYTANAS
jgi:hypothetical protein